MDGDPPDVVAQSHFDDQLAAEIVHQEARSVFP